MIPTEPGIYRLTHAEHRAIPAISPSDLHRWVSGEDEPDGGRQLLFGTVFHLMILQPGEVKARVAIGPNADLRTTDGKAAWEAFEAANAGKLCIRPSEADLLRAMKAAVKAHPTLSKALALVAPDNVETSIVWRDPDTGLLLKGCIDQVGARSLLDWKTSGYNCAAEFDAALPKFGYHVQGAMYTDGWKELTQEDKAFADCCVSKRVPIGSWLRQITDHELAFGRREYKGLLRLRKRYADQAAATPAPKPSPDPVTVKSDIAAPNLVSGPDDIPF
jgi:hypothetical protein